MIYLKRAVPMFFLPVAAHAHASEMPFILHAVEHGWLTLFLLPLLLLLLPQGRERRR